MRRNQNKNFPYTQYYLLATTNRADRRIVPYRLLRFRDYFFGIIGGVVVVGGVVGNRRTEAIVVLRTDRPI